jgi:hypothetical protein
MNLKFSRKFFYLFKFSIWFFYCLFFLNILSNNNKSEIIVGVAFSAILIQLTLINFINNWYRNGRPNLLDWFRLTTFLVLILNFYNLIEEFNYQNNFNNFLIRKEFILPTLLVLFFGLIGLKLGEIIYLFKNKKINKTTLKKYQIRNIFVFYLVILFTSVVQMYLMVTGEVGYGTLQENTTSNLSFLLQTIFIVAPFILALLSVFKFMYKSKESLLNSFFIFYFTLQLIYGFMSGMKESIIVPCIVVIIPFLLAGNKLPKKLILIGIFSFIFIYPINNNFREVLNYYPKMQRDQALGIAVIKTFELDFKENINNGADDYSTRLSLFPYLVYSIEKENEWTYYKNMDRYIYLPVAWIVPRFILPEKPKSETGGVLNEFIYGRMVGSNSLTVTTFGWAFFEGGYLYVFLLFFLFGLFISYFEFNLGLNSLMGILIYIQILITLLKVETDIYFLISSILQMILINYIFLKILVKEEK